MNKLLIILFFLVYPCFIHGQINQENALKKQSFPVQINADSLIKYYNHQTYNPLAYINGKEYKHYHHHQQSSPYFKSSQGIGNIYIDGNKYCGLNIIYDVYLDELIALPTEFAYKNVFININKTHIDSFDITIDNQSFTLTNFQQLDSKSSITDGFYEVAYENEYILLIQHYCTKTISDGYKVYDSKMNKFLFINGEYVNINNKRKFLSLFPEHKRRLKKSYRKSQSIYKDLNTSQLVQLVKYAESL